MTTEEIKNTAEQTFKDYPDKSEVFVCEDGIVYFKERAANEHNARFVHKKVHAFTRAELSEDAAADAEAKAKADTGKKGK